MRKNITYIKALGIILVVLGHMNYVNQDIKPIIYSFHMPLFFFVAGLSLKSTRISIQYILKKIKRLIIPYFIWALFYSSLSFKNFARIIYGSYEMICSADSLSSLWYLPCLFVSIILSKCAVEKLDKLWKNLVICFVSILIGVYLPHFIIGYPFCFDVAFIGMAFIILGYIINMHLSNKNIVILVFAIILGISAIIIGQKNAYDNPGYALLAKRVLGNPVLFLLPSVGGCLALYGISQVLCINNIPKVFDKPLTILGDNSLTIMLVHKPIIALVQMLPFNHIPQTIQLIVGSIIVITISALIAQLFKRFLPFLIGEIHV